MNELGTTRSEIIEKQAVSDDTQTSISIIKYEIQNSIKNNGPE